MEIPQDQVLAAWKQRCADLMEENVILQTVVQTLQNQESEATSE